MWMKQVSADLNSPILNGVVELSGSVSKNRLLKIREETLESLRNVRI